MRRLPVLEQRSRRQGGVAGGIINYDDSGHYTLASWPVLQYSGSNLSKEMKRTPTLRGSASKMTTIKVFTELRTHLDLYGRFQFLLPNRISTFVSLSISFLTILAGFIGTPKESGNSFGMGSGYYSSACMQLFLVCKRSSVYQIIEDMRSVAISIERKACTVTKEELQKTTRTCQRTIRIFRWYITATAVIAVFLPVLTLTPVCETWPAPTDPIGFYVILFGQFFTGLYGAVAYTQVVPWVYCSNALSVTFFRALGRRLERAKGREKILNVVRLHQSLLLIVRRVDNLHSRYMAHFMVVLLVPTLTSVHEIKMGHGFGAIMSACPLLAMTFVPWCSIGQELEDATTDMSFRAYSGDWLNEDCKSRQPRLALMIRAKKCSTVSVHGLGTLNLPTCRNVLKNWFSYLQLVLKL